MLSRRGKGEASFLHCKSPAREEPYVTEEEGCRGRKRQRETKERKGGERRGEVETEVKENVGKRRAKTEKERRRK